MAFQYEETRCESSNYEPKSFDVKELTPECICAVKQIAAEVSRNPGPFVIFLARVLHLLSTEVSLLPVFSGTNWASHPYKVAASYVYLSRLASSSVTLRHAASALGATHCKFMPLDDLVVGSATLKRLLDATVMACESSWVSPLMGPNVLMGLSKKAAPCVSMMSLPDSADSLDHHLPLTNPGHRGSEFNGVYASPEFTGPSVGMGSRSTPIPSEASGVPPALVASAIGFFKTVDALRACVTFLGCVTDWFVRGALDASMHSDNTAASDDKQASWCPSAAEFERLVSELQAAVPASEVAALRVWSSGPPQKGEERTQTSPHPASPLVEPANVDSVLHEPVASDAPAGPGRVRSRPVAERRDRVGHEGAPAALTSQLDSPLENKLPAEMHAASPGLPRGTGDRWTVRLTSRPSVDVEAWLGEGGSAAGGAAQAAPEASVEFGRSITPPLSLPPSAAGTPGASRADVLPAAAALMADSAKASDATSLSRVSKGSPPVVLTGLVDETTCNVGQCIATFGWEQPAGSLPDGHPLRLLAVTSSQSLDVNPLTSPDVATLLDLPPHERRSSTSCLPEGEIEVTVGADPAEPATVVMGDCSMDISTGYARALVATSASRSTIPPATYLSAKSDCGAVPCCSSEPVVVPLSPVDFPESRHVTSGQMMGTSRPASPLVDMRTMSPVLGTSTISPLHPPSRRRFPGDDSLRSMSLRSMPESGTPRAGQQVPPEGARAGERLAVVIHDDTTAALRRPRPPLANIAQRTPSNEPPSPRMDLALDGRVSGSTEDTVADLNAAAPRSAPPVSPASLSSGPLPGSLPSQLPGVASSLSGRVAERNQRPRKRATFGGSLSIVLVPIERETPVKSSLEYQASMVRRPKPLADAGKDVWSAAGLCKTSAPGMRTPVVRGPSGCASFDGAFVSKPDDLLTQPLPPMGTTMLATSTEAGPAGESPRAMAVSPPVASNVHLFVNGESTAGGGGYSGHVRVAEPTVEDGDNALRHRQVGGSRRLVQAKQRMARNAIREAAMAL
eukprot:TRINITY_DN2212_c0_g1_i1.p1 TRINITY_DN2212_c0_g1~~TRINITY_DN2212_c0_g1_i1.p1  ORF type:complete len:1021 (-),score=115.27 TRINITY_DN2212_c0_g1_i1:2193-5255(-)